MKLLTGYGYAKTMLEISKSNFHRLKEAGYNTTWDDVVRFHHDVSRIELKTEHKVFLKKIEGYFGDRLDGVHVVPVIEEKVLELAELHNIPMATGLAAAVLPNDLGMEIIAINLSTMAWHPDAVYVIEHELHHLKQIRRGDLHLGEDGNICWTGWDVPTKLSLTNNLDNYKFACGDVKMLVHREITQKPWEAEAYALTLPVHRWDSYFNEATKEYLMTNWHRFNPN